MVVPSACELWLMPEAVDAEAKVGRGTVKVDVGKAAELVDRGHHEGGTGGTTALVGACCPAAQGDLIAARGAAASDGGRVRSFRDAVTLSAGCALAPPRLHVRLDVDGQHLRGIEAARHLEKHMDCLLSEQKLSADKGPVAVALHIEGACIEDVGFATLVDVLVRHGASIVSAKLCYNSITDESVARLASALRDQDLAVEEVHLSHDSLTERSLVALCICVADNRRFCASRWVAPAYPCWVRLEGNCISEPDQVLDMLRIDGRVAVGEATDRLACGQQRCTKMHGDPLAADSPAIHLFDLEAQCRCGDEVPLGEDELLELIRSWQRRGGLHWMASEAGAGLDYRILPPRVPTTSLPKLWSDEDMRVEECQQPVLLGRIEDSPKRMRLYSGAGGADDDASKLGSFGGSSDGPQQAASSCASPPLVVWADGKRSKNKIWNGAVAKAPEQGKAHSQMCITGDGPLKSVLAQGDALAAESSDEGEHATQSLSAVLKEMVSFMDFGPLSLREAIKQIVAVGWEHITWRKGYTALHLVAELGCAEFMPLLILLGADLIAVDAKGRTALEVARRKRQPTAEAMLRQLAACRGLVEIAAARSCDRDDTSTVLDSLPVLYSGASFLGDEPLPRATRLVTSPLTPPTDSSLVAPMSPQRLSYEGSWARVAAPTDDVRRLKLVVRVLGRLLRAQPAFVHAPARAATEGFNSGALRLVPCAHTAAVRLAQHSVPGKVQSDFPRIAGKFKGISVTEAGSTRALPGALHGSQSHYGFTWPAPINRLPPPPRSPLATAPLSAERGLQQR